MKIRFSTRNNKNGNKYQLIIDTDALTYNFGNNLFMSCDFHVSKAEITEFIRFDLRIGGFSYNADLH